MSLTSHHPHHYRQLFRTVQDSVAEGDMHEENNPELSGNIPLTALDYTDTSNCIFSWLAMKETIITIVKD
jgi:hypothetical protein